MQSQLSVQNTRLGTVKAQKCEIYFTTFIGNHTDDYSRVITLGYRPKVVILTSNYGSSQYSAMSVDLEEQSIGPIRILDNGVAVRYETTVGVNQRDVPYFGLIFR